MLEWADDLKICQTNLYLDGRQPRELCLVSHAHSDHIAGHGHILATPETLAMVDHRIGVNAAKAISYGETRVLGNTLAVQALSAGHVLGSAMFHITRGDESLLYTGDYKLRSSLTVPKAEPKRADVLLMESTYGQPFFRFPPAEEVMQQLVDLVRAAMAEGRQAIVLGYSLGKAQEATRILTDAGLRVTLHGAVASVCAIYERFGVELGSYRRYASADFHGPRALDVIERGVLVAPPNCARSPFVTRFKNPLRIMLSGWGLLKDARYRYGVDHVLPLSDHADFDELLQTIEIVEPRRIYTHHGFPDFVDELRKRGHDARLARPPAQMSLFE